MKRIITTLATIGLLAFAAPVMASTHSCRSVYPTVDISVKVLPPATCKMAAAIERHAGPLGVEFFAGGREWLGAVYSRAHGHTYFMFVSPGRQPYAVWLTNRGAVS